MRNGGAAHKNIEAPRNLDSASRRCHLERSREISLAERSVCQLRYFNHLLLSIPNPYFQTSGGDGGFAAIIYRAMPAEAQLYVAVSIPSA